MEGEEAERVVGEEVERVVGEERKSDNYPYPTFFKFFYDKGFIFSASSAISGFPQDLIYFLLKYRFS